MELLIDRHGVRTDAHADVGSGGDERLGDALDTSHDLSRSIHDHDVIEKAATADDLLKDGITALRSHLGDPSTNLFAIRANRRLQARWCPLCPWGPMQAGLHEDGQIRPGDGLLIGDRGVRCPHPNTSSRPAQLELVKSSRYDVMGRIWDDRAQLFAPER
jgi:hypothetical protein